LADNRKSSSSELSNALLRSIAQHSQVEPTVKPTVEPTIKTTVDIHQYRSELITIDLTTMPINIQSELIAIAAATRIQAFIGHLAIYAS
jgi:hypothetical protein